jgi:hypothetical protein
MVVRRQLTASTIQARRACREISPVAGRPDI